MTDVGPSRTLDRRPTQSIAVYHCVEAAIASVLLRLRFPELFKAALLNHFQLLQGNNPLRQIDRSGLNATGRKQRLRPRLVADKRYLAAFDTNGFCTLGQQRQIGIELGVLRVSICGNARSVGESSFASFSPGGKSKGSSSIFVQVASGSAPSIKRKLSSTILGRPDMWVRVCRTVMSLHDAGSPSRYLGSGP
jgi:hypothetical protein